MTKTLLIVIGILFAMTTAIIIMRYNNTAISSDVIYKQLYDKNPKVRAKAIWDLAFVLHDKESIPEIRKRLYDEDVNVRQGAILALGGRFGGLNDQESIPQVRKFLNDNDNWIRYNSIHFLTFLNDQESIPEIKKLLHDNDESIRKFSQDALKQLGVPEEEIERAKSK